MLEEFICKVLVMILGYAYPAFQCFRTMEDSRVDINDLRFWCQYWIIVAMLSVCEKFGDIFISWVPLYEELKLAFIIYLWYPRTRGTSYVYETLLRPLVSSHETDIEGFLKDLRLRAWDLAIYYWQNCTELGQGAFVQVIQYLLTQSQRLKSGNNGVPQENDKDHRPRGGSPPQPPPPMDYIPPASPPHRRPVPVHITNPRHGNRDTPSSSPSGPFRRWEPQPSAPPMPPPMRYKAAPLPNPTTVRYWAQSNPNHSGN